MTRKRVFNPHAYYHVIIRGNNRQPIFRTKEDMFELKRAFLHVHADYPFKLLAYCFMTNYYHILIKAERDPLHKIMGLINRRYSASYAKRYGHIGRIYQKRYFAKEVDSRSACSPSAATSTATRFRQSGRWSSAWSCIHTVRSRFTGTNYSRHPPF